MVGWVAEIGELRIVFGRGVTWRITGGVSALEVLDWRRQMGWPEGFVRLGTTREASWGGAEQEGVGVGDSGGSREQRAEFAGVYLSKKGWQRGEGSGNGGREGLGLA